VSGSEQSPGPQAVVLAGGLATRMLPRTQTVPKALLEVAGRPFIDWQLELLAGRGIRDVVICIAHLGNLIRDHVGDGARHGLRVTWSEERPGQLLGTAGAVRAALAHLAPCFVVTYGDSYLPFDYCAPLQVLAAHDDCDGVMAVYRNQGRWDASNVITDGTWVTCYAKGMADPRFDHIDYGATALRREVIAALPAGERIGLDEIQSQLAGAGRLRSVVARDRFFEIGSPGGLAELDHHLRASS
jgi:N-acetyl-alpha-D-muramate 1-phosphate uridylyltransferase